MPLLYRLLTFYPPFLLAGIRVHATAADLHTMRSSMGLYWYNRNAFGTHFGGSLYAMCDPFFALILSNCLGPDYVVWDRAAGIEFVRPGRGRVAATFHIPPEQVKAIRQKAAAGAPVLPEFDVDVLDTEGQVVAHVHKQLYVRLRRQGQAG